jgi:hypothetical protein
MMSRANAIWNTAFCRNMRAVNAMPNLRTMMPNIQKKVSGRKW